LGFSNGGGTWSREGFILFEGEDGLLGGAENGGGPQPVMQLGTARKEKAPLLPPILPPGEPFLYFISSSDPRAQAFSSGSPDNPKARIRILATERKAYYAPPQQGKTGYLLWLREQTLMAKPFDAGRLRLEGDATPLAEDVSVSPPGYVRAAFWASEA